VATIFGKTWDLHVEKVLRFSLQQNLDIIGDTVAYLKKHMDEVIYDAEHFFDGYKHNRDMLSTRWPRPKARVRIASCWCDTNGGMLPDEFIKVCV